MRTKKCCFERVVISVILMFLFGSMVFAGDFISLLTDLAKYLDDNPVVKKKAEALSKQIKEILEQVNNNRNATIRIGGGYSMNESNLIELNESGEGKKSLYEFSLQVGASKGIFPYEFGFKAKTSTKYEKADLKESLNEMLIEYKRYYGKYFKTYCFAERFSDEYLSIDHRYEIGAGIKGEIELLGKKNPIIPSHNGNAKDFVDDSRKLLNDIEQLLDSIKVNNSLETPLYQKKALDYLNKIKPLLEPIRCKYDLDESLDYLDKIIKLLEPIKDKCDLKESFDYLNKIKIQVEPIKNKYDLKTALDYLNEIIKLLEPIKGKNDLEKSLYYQFILIKDNRDSENEIAELLKSMATSYAKRNALLAGGFATTIFKELEQATITTYLDGPETNPDGTPIKSDKSEDFSLPAEHRYRFAFRPSITFRPTNDITISGEFYFKYNLGKPQKYYNKRGLRKDFYLTIEFRLKDTSWAQKIAIVAEYAFHTDTTPPRIPEETLSNDEYKGKSFRYKVANNKHQQLQISMNIEL